MKRIGMQAKNFQPVCLRCQPDDQDPLCRGCERYAREKYAQYKAQKLKEVKT